MEFKLAFNLKKKSPLVVAEQTNAHLYGYISCKSIRTQE